MSCVKSTSLSEIYTVKTEELLFNFTSVAVMHSQSHDGSHNAC